MTYLQIILLVMTGLIDNTYPKQSLVNFIEVDLEVAKDMAVNESKLIFVSFTADWCAPCHHLDQTIFSDEEVSKLINENFVPIKANIEDFDGLEWNQLYHADYLPTLIFAAKNGNEYQRIKGLPSKSEIIDVLEKLKPVANLDTENSNPKRLVSKPIKTANKSVINPLPNTGGYTIQLGAFRSYENAQKLQNKIMESYQNCRIENLNKLYKVMLTGYANKNEAREHLELIRHKGFDCFLKSNEP